MNWAGDRRSLDGYLGPLAGVLAGLDWAAGRAPPMSQAWRPTRHSFRVIWWRSLVMPATRFSGMWLAAMKTVSFGGNPPWSVAVSLRDDLRQALGEEAIRKIVIWTDRHNAGMAEFAETEGTDPFFNVNTPDDLIRAQTILQGFADESFWHHGLKNGGKTGLVERPVAEFTTWFGC